MRDHESPSPIPNAAVCRFMTATMFGGYRFIVDDRELALSHHPALASLLAFLCCNNDEYLSRTAIATALYPEHERDLALSNLRVRLDRLEYIAPGIVTRSKTSCFIATNIVVSVDALEFEQAIGDTEGRLYNQTARERLRAAINSYRGDFLAGIEETWAIRLRNHFRDLSNRAAQRLWTFEREHGNEREYLDLERRFPNTFGIDRLELSLSAGKIINQTKKSLGASIVAPAEFIGRQEELSRISRILSEISKGTRASDHGGTAVVIEGEPGIGKSRLCAQVGRDAEWFGLTVVRVQCKPHDCSSPSFIRQIALQLLPSATLYGVQAAIEPVYLQVLADLAPELRTILPNLGHAASLEPAAAAERLIDAMQRLFEAWSELSPLVIIAEDIHWIDDDDAQIVGTVFPRLTGRRIAFVATFRRYELMHHQEAAEIARGMATLDRAVRIRLEGLAPDECAELVQALLPGYKTIASLERFIIAESGGNPLFIVKKLEVLQGEGLLTIANDGAWQFNEIAADDAHLLPVHADIERLILRRAAMLDEHHLATIRAASVAGPDVGVPIIADMLSMSRSDTALIVRDLVVWGFLVPAGDDYTFFHDTIREVIYRSIEEQSKTMLHEKAYRAGIVSGMEILARFRHCAAAGLHGPAIDLCRTIVEQAIGRYQNQRVVEYCDRALELLPLHQLPDEDREHLSLWFLSRKSEILLRTGQGQQWNATISTALMIATSLDDEKEIINVKSLALDELAQVPATWDLAARFVEDLSMYAHKYNQRLLLARTVIWKSGYYLNRSLFSEAHTFAQQAVDLLETIDDEDFRLSCLARASYLMFFLGDMQEFQRLFSIAEPLLAASRDPRFLAKYYALKANCETYALNCQKALHWSEKALAVSKMVGIEFNIITGIRRLGRIHLYMHNYPEAERCFIESYERSVNRCITILTGNCLYYWFRCNRLSGKPMDRVLTEFDRIKDTLTPQWQTYCLIELCRYNLEAGDHTTAQGLLEEIRNWAPSINRVLGIEAKLAGLYGDVFFSNGQYRKALHEFERMLKIADDMTDREYTWRAMIDIAICSHRLGDSDRALALSAEVESSLAAHSFYGTDAATILLLRHIILKENNQFEVSVATLKVAHNLVELMQSAITDPEWRTAIVDRVAVNREIERRWEIYCAEVRGGTVALELPAGTGTHRGRYRTTEKVAAVLTVNHPTDEAIPDKAERRRVRIFRILDECKQQGVLLPVEQLATLLGVSKITLIRDLKRIRDTSSS